MKLIASAIFFVVVIALVFWRERRRWRKAQAQQKEIDEVLSPLMQRATEKYQAKYGRAPSVLEDLPQIVQASKR